MSASLEDVHIRSAQNAIHTTFDHSSVASAKPAIAEGIACRFGLAPVLRENVRTTDFDFTRRSARNRNTIVSHKLHFDARQRCSDAAGNTLTPQRVRQRHSDLRHAVTLKQSVASDFLP